MDLMWWGVVILGLALLAGCVAAAMLRPDDADRRELRLLAHVDRLTRLPEYVRAVRRRLVSLVVVIALVAVGFAAALLATARPSGWPHLGGASAAAQPEDIMVCVGESPEEPAVARALDYFAERIGTLGTARIGLTAANARVVPLTRDYQHAAAQFRSYARSEAAVSPVSPVSYVDYAPTVEDVVALCLTGFPSFEEPTGQRRSLVYVGPGSFGAAGTTPSLFSAERLRELATTAGVQVNVVYTGDPSDSLDALARDTGGLSAGPTTDVPPRLAEIRNNPPAPGAADDAGTAVGAETPGVPLLLAVLALLALALWPVVRRS
ncbi:hypothetical protein [Mycolicibacterium sp.]|uniref:hypothetical protein n=1 Tax=Mycolicibacterium sp. TaxID=2320850 RepID=UPI00355DA2DB